MSSSSFFVCFVTNVIILELVYSSIVMERWKEISIEWTAHHLTLSAKDREGKFQVEDEVLPADVADENSREERGAHFAHSDFDREHKNQRK